MCKKCTVHIFVLSLEINNAKTVARKTFRTKLSSFSHFLNVVLEEGWVHSVRWRISPNACYNLGLNIWNKLDFCYFLHFLIKEFTSEYSSLPFQFIWPSEYFRILVPSISVYLAFRILQNTRPFHFSLFGLQNTSEYSSLPFQFIWPSEYFRILVPSISVYLAFRILQNTRPFHFSLFGLQNTSEYSSLPFQFIWPLLQNTRPFQAPWTWLHSRKRLHRNSFP